MTLRPLLAATMASLLLAACAGVPDKLPPPTLRDHVPLAGLPARTDASWPAQDWWKRYHDPQLDQLIELAMKGSPTLAVAHSRVGQAEQAIRVTAAQSGLRVDASASVARQRLSEHGLIPTRFLGFTWYNQGDIGAQLSYDFDWWGRKHDLLQAAVGQARAAEAQRSAAALSLQTAVADTYFGWLADHARLRLMSQRVDDRQRLENIEQARVDAGLEPSDRLQQTRAQLAGARRQQESMRASAAIRRTALAALLGLSPDQLPPLQPRPLPAVSAGLPAHAGLDLIARRPDIAASRWQVEAASRQVAAARAAFYPDISISALAGLSSIDLGKLLDASSRTFSVTPAIHLPLFDSGLLKAAYGVSRAQLDDAVAQYNATVVDAARDVASRTLTVRSLRAQRLEQTQQLDATRALVRTSAARMRQGITDAGPALQAQLQWLQQRDADAALHAAALSADVALIQSLGGGYRDPHANAPTAPSSPSNRTPTP